MYFQNKLLHIFLKTNHAIMLLNMQTHIFFHLRLMQMLVGLMYMSEHNLMRYHRQNKDQHMLMSKNYF